MTGTKHQPEIRSNTSVADAVPGSRNSRACAKGLDDVEPSLPHPSDRERATRA